MPRWLSSAPRKKLPPPTTIATCTPESTTPAIWRAIEATTSGSTPTAPPPKTSPDSLSSTRRNHAGWSGTTSDGATSVSLIGSPFPSRSGSTLPAGPRRPPRGGGPGGDDTDGADDSADLEVGELRDRHARLVEQRLHRLLVVDDRGLLEQHVVLEVPVDAALDDLGQGLLGAAVLAGLGLGDALLGLDDLGRDLVAGQGRRAHGSDLHGRGAGGLLVDAVELDEHADLRRQVGGLAVQVGGDLAVELDGAAQLELLADDGGERLDVLLDRLAVLERLGPQLVEVVGARVREVGDDVAGEGLELLVLRDEVGLGGELDHRALRGGDQAVGGGALGAALGGLRLALDAEDLERLVEVAVGLVESLLALHHSGAGGVAEALDVRGGEVAHQVCLSVRDCLGGTVSGRVVSGGGGRLLAGGLGRRRGVAGGTGGAQQLGLPLGHRLVGGELAAAGLGLLVSPGVRRGRGAGDEALGDGVGDHAGQQRGAADRVVVARDRVVDLVRVAVGVEDGDDRDVELACLADGDVLLLGVHHPDGARNLRHFPDAAEGALELGLLAAEHELLLLGGDALPAALLLRLELLEPLQAAEDGLEVGEHAAEPALVDVGHADAGGLLGDRLLGLLLRADEQHAAAVRDGLLDEVVGAVDVGQR